MFVTATFHGQKRETRAAVPATAILHLHDRDWVYVPAKDNQFRRVEVTAGDMLPGNQQEIISGVAPGQQVVSNALRIPEHGGTVMIRKPRRFRSQQPLHRSRASPCFFLLWGIDRVQETARWRLIPTLRTRGFR